MPVDEEDYKRHFTQRKRKLIENTRESSLVKEMISTPDVCMALSIGSLKGRTCVHAPLIQTRVKANGTSKQRGSSTWQRP